MDASVRVPGYENLILRGKNSAPPIWLFGDYSQAESRVVAWKGPVPKLKQWYKEGVDVHLLVCKSIAKVVQENKFVIPGGLFMNKHWDEYTKRDEEREISKRTVHANNYDMGVKKYALITGLPEQYAGILQKIYFTLFAEVKTNYHQWVQVTIRKTKTIWMPDPVKFRKIFWDASNVISDELMRSAYSCYPQCTVGAMLNKLIAECTTIFLKDENEEYRDQWQAWYGPENWDKWRSMRDRHIKSPQAILWSGLDIRLNVHDAGGISIPNNGDLLHWAASEWKRRGEVPILIEPGFTKEIDPLVIPIDFKTGPTWGGSDQTEYKLAA